MEVEIVQDQQDENMIILSGGDGNNPTWKEYINNLKDEWKPKFEILKEFIKESDYYQVTANNFCNDNHFRFSDGTEIAFTWRAWGDLMQAIVNKREGYMTYYM